MELSQTRVIENIYKTNRVKLYVPIDIKNLSNLISSDYYAIIALITVCVVTFKVT